MTLNNGYTGVGYMIIKNKMWNYIQYVYIKYKCIQTCSLTYLRLTAYPKVLYTTEPLSLF